MQHLPLSLLLTCFSVLCRQIASLPSQEDLLVEGLEKYEPAYGEFPGKMYAGRLPMDNGNRHGELYFWLFDPDEPIVDDAFLMWLNGGPGCSSINAGALFEHSPVVVPPRPAGYCCTDKDVPLVYNNYSWGLAAPILYLEQPVNVGFSEGSPDPVNEDEVSGDAYAFLVNFFHVFPQFKTNRLVVSGESYAGYFVPSIAHKIYMENIKPSSRNSIKINLDGVAAGNALMDAEGQGPQPIDIAYWHGMIDLNTRDNIYAEWEHCLANRDKNNKDGPEPKPFHNFNIPDECGVMEAVLMASGAGAFNGATGPNTYDVTTWDDYPVFQNGNTTFERFLNNPKVKECIHAPADIYWLGCIPGAGRRRRKQRHLLKSTATGDRKLAAHLLEQDRPASVVPYIADLLDGGHRVLIYNADRDLSVGPQGSEKLLNEMNWQGKNRWFKAPRGLWASPAKDISGYSKELDGLSFVVVYNAGHLVPYNQPEHALDLIVRFLKKQTYADYPLPSFNKVAKTVRQSALMPASHTDSDGAGSQPIRGVIILIALVVSFAGGFMVSSLTRKTGYEKVGH